MKVKVKVGSASCSFFVQGMDMNCPLCGVLVLSGERHECSRPESQKVSPLGQTDRRARKEKGGATENRKRLN